MMVSDEEKRWLVVGIAMNKVAAPVLRDFIKQGMVTHYTNLDIYCSGLATPCTLKTLTYHQVSTDPCFKHLKFQNVNNNFQLYGMKKRDLHKYNYNINSSVDYAKLFLPDYLTKFSGFDESLDMSAILRLLGYNNPAPIFLSPNPLISIQLEADDVRENVRNKWGHCNVTDWTEVLFSDCFSKLETLVRSLGLTGGLEKTILDQLSDWQTKGCQLCIGHAVDKHLLSLVQGEVKGIIADLAGHDARLDAVETKLEKDEEARREEIDKILEKLLSMKKILSEELMRRVEGVEQRVEGVEQGLAETNINVEVQGKRVEGAEEGLAAANVKVEGLGQSMAQLQDSLTKTVEQLAHEIKSQRMEDVKPAVAPAETFDVKSCQSKLAEHYKRTATVPTSVWSKTSPVDIHQIYTRLSCVKEEKTPAGSSRSKLNHYTDVFTANKNGVIPKRILVQGQTGIGKSTFVKKLAVDWAELDDATTGDKQKDILKKFELLVVVNLKEVSKCQSLKDVISCSSIFAKEEKYLTDSLLNYISNNEDKVLLVFDGYDEYCCGNKSEIYEIFRGNELRNCCVLITSRISKADGLLTSQVDMQAEITGFSKKDGEAFMSRMLGGKREAEELSHHLSREKLTNLAKVPLLLLFFCTLWKKGKSKSVTESKTKLYLAIVQYVLDYNQEKDCPARLGNVDDFKDVLAEIGKVALECLLKDDHVFDYDQMSAAVLCDESVIIGLLQVTEYAENLRPAGMVSFIHKSIQEFLAAWFVTYRCVPEGNLGGIEQHARTLDDCKALENFFQFVCGLSDAGAVKVFQHLTSVRISDPTLDFSKTIPDVENETDVPLCEVTDRHMTFSDLVYHLFIEVQSKAALVRHWLDSTAGIMIITNFWQFPRRIPKMTLLDEAASCKGFVFCRHFDPIFRGKGRKHMSRLYDVLEVFGCLRVLLRITENSGAVLTGDFLRQFKIVGCKKCWFNCILRFHNGKAQFYITDLELRCDDHVRLLNETIAISTPCRFPDQCSKQSCLKFLRYLGCFEIVIAQTFKDVGAVFRNCEHLKTIQFYRCGDAMCELLDHIPNSSTCSLNIDYLILYPFSWLSESTYTLTSAGAEKLAGVLPRFNVTALRLDLEFCCAAAVNKLVCSITHKTLRELALKSVSLTPAAAAALGRSLSKMSCLKELVLIGEIGSVLQAEEMEALFGGINVTFSALERLTLQDFDASGSLAPLTKRVQFFPKLTWLKFSSLNMDERDLDGLLESLRSIPNPLTLILNCNPLGSWDRVLSMVQQALPQVELWY